MPVIISSPAHPQPAFSTVVKLDYQTSDSHFDPEAEVKLLVLLNQVRFAHDLRPLVMDGSLRSVAREHSRDMALHGYIGHDSPRGQTFIDRLARVVRGGVFVSENVTVAQTVEQAHSAFTASPLHLKNMLEPAFHRAGIGIATAGQLGIMVTEDFAE